MNMQQHAQVTWGEVKVWRSCGLFNCNSGGQTGYHWMVLGIHRRKNISAVEGSTGSILHVNWLQLFFMETGPRINPATSVDGPQDVDCAECSDTWVGWQRSPCQGEEGNGGGNWEPVWGRVWGPSITRLAFDGDGTGSSTMQDSKWAMSMTAQYQDCTRDRCKQFGQCDNSVMRCHGEMAQQRTQVLASMFVWSEDSEATSWEGKHSKPQPPREVRHQDVTFKWHKTILISPSSRVATSVWMNTTSLFWIITCIFVWKIAPVCLLIQWIWVV